jgi:hypothetical protein
MRRFTVKPRRGLGLGRLGGSVDYDNDNDDDDDNDNDNDNDKFDSSPKVRRRERSMGSPGLGHADIATLGQPR